MDISKKNSQIWNQGKTSTFVGWGVLLDRVEGLGLSGGGCGAKYGRTSEKVNMPKLVMPETF